jgi:hypothetical protein
LRILKNVIETSFINWRVLSLVKINTRISDTPVCIHIQILKYLKCCKALQNTLPELSSNNNSGYCYIQAKIDSDIFGIPIVFKGTFRYD